MTLKLVFGELDDITTGIWWIRWHKCWYLVDQMTLMLVFGTLDDIKAGIWYIR